MMITHEQLGYSIFRHQHISPSIMFLRIKVLNPVIVPAEAAKRKMHH